MIIVLNIICWINFTTCVLGSL